MDYYINKLNFDTEIVIKKYICDQIIQAIKRKKHFFSWFFII